MVQGFKNKQSKVIKKAHQTRKNKPSKKIVSSISDKHGVKLKNAIDHNIEALVADRVI